MQYILLIALMTQLLLAAPAFNGKRTFTQPNGENIEYRLQGDEYLHWLEADDGSLMLYNKKSKQLESLIIEDGTIKPSGKAIHQAVSQSSENRSARALQPDTSQIVTKETLLKLQQERRLKRHSKTKKSSAHTHH